MDKHVFVSYKHEDVDFAENLISRIKEAGFTAWQDSDKLHPGEDWRAGIDQAIKSAFALIVIMTPEAKSSEYVTYEWSFAWGAGVKVIPVVLKRTELHPRLEALQYLDFTNLSARPWGKLINALKDASTQTSSTASPSPDISPQIIEAAKLLVAAAIDQMKAAESRSDLVPESKGATATPHGINGARETAERIRQLITPGASEQLDRASVLWVDDRPANNTYERHALEALGIRFDISTSTQDALQLLRQKKYDAVISDMGRPPDPRAGYTLLKKVQEMGMTIPFIIYAGSRSPEHIAEARSKGAIGTTNDPQELFEIVITAIKNG